MALAPSPRHLAGLLLALVFGIGILVGSMWTASREMDYDVRETERILHERDRTVRETERAIDQLPSRPTLHERLDAIEHRLQAIEQRLTP
jgi:hypothetical protein